MPCKRIISLVPSLTELIIYFGLQEQLVGRTRFCIHPKEKIKSIPIIGGTKNPNIEKILALQPDLIIANKEENRKKDIDELCKYVEVIVTEIDTIDDALKWIKRLGNKLGVENEAETIISSVRGFITETGPFKELKTAYFIWKDPWMTVGNDTYIHDVMARFGLHNVFKDRTRYPETELTELVSLNPELILLSSEPFPFKEKHIQEIRVVCPNATIELVNGEWFSWYGSRMVPSFKALKNWHTKF